MDQPPRGLGAQGRPGGARRSTAARRSPSSGGAEQTRVAHEEILCGLRCALAVFDKRPHDILRVLHDPAHRDELGPLIRWAAGAGVPCHAIGAEGELARVAGSPQHEGVVLAVKPRTFLPAKQLGPQLIERSGLLVALDRVRNPQNIGAIARSAAFFGAAGLLLGAPAPNPGLDPFAQRVAEGGAEHLILSRTTDLVATLAQLRSQGVTVVGAHARGSEDAATFVLAGPSVLVLGHEREGLAARVLDQTDRTVAIRGSGQMESLNVAVAAGVLLARWRPSAPPA